MGGPWYHKGMRKALWLSISVILSINISLRAETGAQPQSGVPSGQMTLGLLNALEESGDANLAFDHNSQPRPTPEASAPGQRAILAPLAAPQLSRELRLAKPGVKSPERKNRGRLKDNSGLAFGVMAAGGGLGIWGGLILAGLVGGGLPVAFVFGILGFWAGASSANCFFPE